LTLELSDLLDLEYSPHPIGFNLMEVGVGAGSDETAGPTFPAALSRFGRL
jgi:hypothetical protein